MDRIYWVESIFDEGNNFAIEIICVVEIVWSKMVVGE